MVNKTTRGGFRTKIVDTESGDVAFIGFTDDKSCSVFLTFNVDVIVCNKGEIVEVIDEVEKTLKTKYISKALGWVLTN